MDAFAHFIFKSKTSVRILDINGQIRIQVSGSLPNERITIEVDQMTDLSIAESLKEQLK